MASDEPFSRDDSNYKREEDRKWRERTEERVVGLTSSESVQNDRLDEIDEELQEIHAILDGKSDDKNDNGLKGELHDLSRSYNELRALMMPDHLGSGGVINRLKALEQKTGLEEKKSEQFWTFSRAVVVAILTLLGVMLANLDKIGTFLHSKPKDPLGEMVYSAKHPKGRHIRRKLPTDMDGSQVSKESEE